MSIIRIFNKKGNERKKPYTEISKVNLTSSSTRESDKARKELLFVSSIMSQISPENQEFNPLLQMLNGKPLKTENAKRLKNKKVKKLKTKIKDRDIQEKLLRNNKKITALSFNFWFDLWSKIKKPSKMKNYKTKQIHRTTINKVNTDILQYKTPRSRILSEVSAVNTSGIIRQQDSTITFIATQQETPKTFVMQEINRKTIKTLGSKIKTQTTNIQRYQSQKPISFVEMLKESRNTSMENDFLEEIR